MSTSRTSTICRFCMMFVSTDDLHRRCAPHFLRPDQQFVWGPALKEDLRRINEHFIALPDSVKEQGIMEFAQAPPKRDGSLVRELRAQFLAPGYDDQPPVPVPEGEQGAELVQHLNAWSSAPTAPMDISIRDNDELEMMALERKVHRKKGSGIKSRRACRNRRMMIDPGRMSLNGRCP